MDLFALLARAQRTGLSLEGLSPEACAKLARARDDALAETGRVALGCADMQELADAFLEACGDVPPEAVEAFYAVRDDLPADIPDEEIARALACACAEAGGDVGCIDVSVVTRLLAAREDSVYVIADDEGRAYRWDPAEWAYDEQAPGWDDEPWAEGCHE